MKKNSHTIFVLFLFFTLFKCENNTGKNNVVSLGEVEITNAFKNRGALNLTTLGIKDIEYVRLETSKESLIGGNSSFFIDDDFIYAIAFRQVQLFNRSNGKFVRELGRYGQGPEEYRNTLPNIKKSLSNEIFVQKGEDIFSLDSDNIFKKKFTLPNSVTTFSQLTDTTFAGFIPNYACMVEDKLIIFDSSGEEVASFPNHQNCVQNTTSISFDFDEGIFFYHRNETYFKESFNDTLFHIKNNELTPTYIFQLGKYKQPYERKNVLADSEKFNRASIDKIGIFNDYLFFRLYLHKRQFYGIYDVSHGITLLSERSQNKEINGFVNDIDNFVDFYPSYTEDTNQLVGFIQAEEIYQWFQNNPEKVDKLPESLKNFKNILPDGNPVIMIGKLKN